LCPIKGLAEDLVSALNVGLAFDRRNGPVSDGNADQVETEGSNLVEVILVDVSMLRWSKDVCLLYLCDPGIPVLSEERLCSVRSKLLSKGILFWESAYVIGGKD